MCHLPNLFVLTRYHHEPFLTLTLLLLLPSHLLTQLLLLLLLLVGIVSLHHVKLDHRPPQVRGLPLEWLSVVTLYLW